VPAISREIKDSTRRSAEMVAGALQVRVASTGAQRRTRVAARPAARAGQGVAAFTNPRVIRLKGGQLASALVRPRRMRDPGATSTQGLREVPGGARKGAWVVTVLRRSDDLIAKPRWALGCPEHLARPKERTDSAKPGLSWPTAGSSRQPLIGAPVSGSCSTAYAPKACNHLLFGQCCTLGYRNNAVFA